MAATPRNFYALADAIWSQPRSKLTRTRRSIMVVRCIRRHLKWLIDGAVDPIEFMTQADAVCDARDKPLKHHYRRLGIPPVTTPQEDAFQKMLWDGSIRQRNGSFRCGCISEAMDAADGVDEDVAEWAAALDLRRHGELHSWIAKNDQELGSWKRQGAKLK